MIKKLQKKFIAIAMLSMLFVTIGVVGTINIANIIRTNEQNDFILQLIAGNDGSFPEFDNGKQNENNIITQETEHATRYFSIKIDNDKNIIDFNLNHIITVKEQQLEEIIEKVTSSEGDTGYYEYYRYLITEKDEYTLIVFLDCRSTLQDRNSIAIYSLVIAGIAFIVVFILVSIFSKRAIKPVLENAEKQREFVTNAGHELKTPVAIIQANAEVLEMKNGEDEWITSIKKQAKRLDILIKNLLKLAKMEEKDMKLNFAKFNLSNVLEETTDAFNVVAQNTTLNMDIQKDIEINGDKDSIEELIVILLDNAIKYVTKGGSVNVNLVSQDKNIKLDISNDCDNLDKKDCERLFERFYRSDSSRDRKTGGYGIGLSMAKSIVETHKGKISAEYKENVIHFIIILPI